MPRAEVVYDAVIRTLRTASPLVGRGHSKVALGIRGRVRAQAVLEDWADVNRDPERPLVWMHAPSVGEGLQAKAALSALLQTHPDLQIAYTYFSPSALPLAPKMPADIAGYLPWDVRSDMQDLMDRMRPDLLAFTKTEVWPGATAAAVRRDVPVFLIAATLPEGARRLRWPGRTLLHPTFGALSRVLAISPEDGERFRRLGVPDDRIEVTGDPGIDSAWSRARAADPGALHLALFLADRRTTLVAGSTWRQDEEVILPAVARVRKRFSDLRVILAPHEPVDAHLADLERRLDAIGLVHGRLGALETRGSVGDIDVVVVDRVGVLAELYTVGDIAFVGGGFGRWGLHSVLEPAAAGRPVLFGPRHRGSAAADALIRIGGGRVVNGKSALAGTLEGWLSDRSLLEEAGQHAAGYIESHRGASERTARALSEYLPTRSGGTG